MCSPAVAIYTYALSSDLLAETRYSKSLHLPVHLHAAIQADRILYPIMHVGHTLQLKMA